MDAPRPPLDVLVADADAGVGALLLAVLRRAGWAAEHVSDAEALHAAVDAPPTARPRALLVERALPGCAAAELLARFEARGVSPPLLVTTAYLEPEERRALCDAPGVTGVVDKPFDLERLLADVGAALAQLPGARRVIPFADEARATESVARTPSSARPRAWFPGGSRGVAPGDAGASELGRGAAAC